MSNPQPKYLFIPGRTPDLSFEELVSVFKDADIKKLRASPIFIVENNKEDYVWAISRLGGIVKIAEILCITQSYSPETLAVLVKEHAESEKIVFGLSVHGEPAITQSFLSEIKKLLVVQGNKVRFVMPQEGSVLSSVVITKQKVQELIIVREGKDVIIAKTRFVQPFEDWNKRDYGRPYADPQSGMLPPKVARMLVNIAVGKNTERFILLDPFCGMGTIIAEALCIGCNAIGSDISADTILKAEKNIAWLNETYNLAGKNTVEFYTSQAEHVSNILKHRKIDAIVTEPYLGPPELGAKRQEVKFSHEKLENIIRGLDKLYIGCFRDWAKILKPEALVCIIFPSYILHRREYFVKRVIDSCEKLGYSKLHGPIEYARPKAVVRRCIYIFKFK